MMYRVEYGLYDIHCGGRQYIHEPTKFLAERRARQLAQHTFNHKVDEGLIRFPKQRDIYEKFINQYGNEAYDKWRAADTRVWAHAEEWYWSMIDDHIWYKVEEVFDPPQLTSVETWVSF